MITLESILPKLKRNEKIVSKKDKGNGYFEFKIEFTRFQYQKQTFEVSISIDDKKVSIRYYHNTDKEWSLKRIQKFVNRLEDSIKAYPDLRLRIVTGAIKVHSEGLVDDEYNSEEIDIHEMYVFFIGLFFALASLFEIFSFFHMKTLGFLILSGLSFAMWFYAFLSVSFESKNDYKDVSTYFYLLVSFLFVFALTAFSIACLIITFVISWILPWFLTAGVFLVAFFSFDWSVKFLKKTFEKKDKFLVG